MKIAFFADSLPPSTDGVAHTFTKLAESLHKEGHEYLFFSPFTPKNVFPWQDKVHTVPSVPLFLYPHYRIGLPALRKIENKLDEFEPDIIHSSSPTFLGRIGLTYAEKNRIPAVSSYHTHFVSYFKYYKLGLAENLGWSFLKWFYNQFDRIYVPSVSAIDELKEKGFENLELWQRGINTKQFSPEKRNYELRKAIAPNNELILLFVGRLVKEKDLDDLIIMDEILRKHNRPFKLVITGDGPMREELEGKLPQAHFTGILKGEALAEMYASADIFTFPSTTETFGNVILEAAASGLPVVGVNQGGVKDIILDGYTGFISEANNPVEFTRFVEALMANRVLRKRIAEKSVSFSSAFNWGTINSKLVASYQDLIQLYQARAAS